MDRHFGEVPDVVDSCVVDFIADERPLRFEIAHTRWLRLWADWHLGRWSEMRSMAHEMVEDATRRNDSYQQLVATMGYSGNALLLSDNLSLLKQLCAGSDQMVADTKTVELVHFFQWMQAIQQALYVADFDSAAECIVRMRQAIGRSPIGRLPLIHVALDFFTALTALHQRQQRAVELDCGRVSSPISDPLIVRNSVRRLRRQHSEYATMLAALIEGIQYRLDGQIETAAESLGSAAECASRLGLFPYQLAAEDALVNLQREGANADSLRQHMLNHNVRHPDRLERLYTVAAPPKAAENAPQSS